MTRFKVLGRFGTLCGVFALMMLTTGCPGLGNNCDGVDVDDNDPCTEDSCVLDDAGEPIIVHTEIEDCCQTAADCNDNDACTIDACSDIEDGAGTCTNTAVGQNCCNDNDDCDDGDVCVNNVCVAEGTGCDDDDDCGDGEVCDADTGECVTDDECTTDDDCDDLDDCTTDTCTDGECENTDVECEDDEVCVDGECVATCEEDVDCLDDANECTTVACVDGACVTSTEDCDDGVDCTTDACDPLTGDCTNVDNCVDGTCNETTGECDGCTGDIDCNDDDDCTTDTCVDGSCQNTNNTAACNDTNACTTNDVCSNGTCAGTAVICPPGQQCNTTTGNCQPIVCDANSDCNDNASCTTDVCNLSTGTCEYTPIDTLCDDNLFCTGTGEFCDPEDEDAEAGTGCVRPGNPCIDGPVAVGKVCNEANDTCIDCTSNAQCSDGFTCTSDTCSAGTCQNTPLDTSCPDPVKCDGDDICDPDDPDANETTGCYAPGNPCCPVPSGPNAGDCLVCDETSYVVGDPNTCEECTSNADCNDGIACTDDECSSGECSHTNDNTLCPDTLFCNGDDICDPDDDDAGADGCVNPLFDGGAVVLGYPCANACNETTNACFNCTGNIDCSDGIACTEDLCNGVTGTCTHNDNCTTGDCNPQNGQCE